MSKAFYPRLAFDNIKKNKQIYIPYILSSLFTIAAFYILTSLTFNKGLLNLKGGDSMVIVMQMGSTIVGIFATIFLFYTNSFLIKRRKKEFGLLNVLGMSKHHISIMIFYETLITFIFSMGFGLLAGVLLDKVMFLGIVRLFSAEVPLGFHISINVLVMTIVLFGIIFICIFLNSLRQVHLSKPIELLNSDSVGEREPKTKWILSIVGIISLSVGYYLSVTTKNPLSAFGTFFIAVMFVIVGTYCLFTAVSITILKMLRKNKKFYYKTNHFISVSGMLYRMKQNAAGLANICILSTMVLVVLSATLSLQIGINDTINTRYPTEISVVRHEVNETTRQDVEKAVEKISSQYQKTPKDIMAYTSLSFSGLRKEDHYVMGMEGTSITDINNVEVLCFITLEDYNLNEGKNEQLNDDQVLFYMNRDTYPYDTVNIFDKNLHIKKQLDNLKVSGFAGANVSTTSYVVVKDLETIKYMDMKQKEVYGENSGNIRFEYGYDLGLSDDLQEAYYQDLQQELTIEGKTPYIESRAIESVGYVAMTSGFLFIGVFLSILFTVATILIIYYKQISEGYEDKKRFEIMEKVGLSQKEVKRTIHSQIIMVFFLPLLLAGVHILFAYPVISKLLFLFNLTNTQLFIQVTGVCFIAFSIAYGIVYSLTAKVYYKIVHSK